MPGRRHHPGMFQKRTNRNATELSPECAGRKLKKLRQGGTCTSEGGGKKTGTASKPGLVLVGGPEMSKIADDLGQEVREQRNKKSRKWEINREVRPPRRPPRGGKRRHEMNFRSRGGAEPATQGVSHTQSRPEKMGGGQKGMGVAKIGVPKTEGGEQSQKKKKKEWPANHAPIHQTTKKEKKKIETEKNHGAKSGQRTARVRLRLEKLGGASLEKPIRQHRGKPCVKNSPSKKKNS